MLDVHKMAELHEEYLAQINDGRRTRGSGNQADDRNDGKNNRIVQPYSFSWDGKSTTGQGINVTRAMIAKASDDAGLERMQLGLRYYSSDRLDAVDYDLVAVRGDDWAEVLQAARKRDELHRQVSDLNQRIEELCGAAEDHAARIRFQEARCAELDEQLAGATRESESLRAQLQAGAGQDNAQPGDAPDLISGLREQLSEAREAHAALDRQLDEARQAAESRDEIIAQRDGELQRLHRAYEGLHRAYEECVRAAGRAAEYYQPPESGLVVSGTHGDGGALSYRGHRFRPGQLPEDYEVHSVRIQPDGAGRQQLFINDVLVREGQLWIDGRMKYEAFPDAPVPQKSE